MSDELSTCQIISIYDEEGSQWPNLFPRLNETGFITGESGLYVTILYPDGERISAPKECVQIDE